MTTSTPQPWYADNRLHFGVGIEDTFVPQEDVGRRKLDEYELTQHDICWRDDLDLAADAGAEFVRWGIPWYRVETRPAVFDWSWIDQVAEHMQRRGLRCVVDLMHYGTPLWLDNQFINAGYPEAVARYSRAVAERYAGVWDDFTTLNEPVWNAINCGERGMWPPALRGQDGFVKVILALARGMIRAQQDIAHVNPSARFIHVEAGFRWEGETVPLARPLLEERRFLSLDLTMGRVGADHPLLAYLTEHGATESELHWFDANAVVPDVIGVNYYPGWTTVRFDHEGREVPVDAGTDGLTDLLTTYSQRYGLPLALTETSRGESEQARVEWVHDSVAAVERLRSQGVAIVAYTWFPFLALYDWRYRESTSPADDWLVQLGLYDLVRGSDGRLDRTATKVLDAFRESALKVHGQLDRHR